MAGMKPTEKPIYFAALLAAALAMAGAATSHLMRLGRVPEGLDIVRACRDRYDGRVRNPFDEYELKGIWFLLRRRVLTLRG